MNINDVKKKIEEIKTFSELDPAFYAPEGKAAHVVALNVKNTMKVTQLRKFFGHIKQIEAKIKGKKNEETFDPTHLYILMPELAYALGRNLISQDFYELMKICLSPKKIKTIGDFRRFVEFFSAILAYHKMVKEV